MPELNSPNITQPVNGLQNHPVAGKPFNFNATRDGVGLPYAIVSCAELLPAARLLWGIIRNASFRDGVCRASDRKLAARLAVSVRHVQRYLAQLQQHGFLQSTERPGYTAERELLWHPVFDSRRPRPLTPTSGGGDADVMGVGHARHPLKRNLSLNSQTGDTSSSSIADVSGAAGKLAMSRRPPKREQPEPTTTKPTPLLVQPGVAEGSHEHFLRDVLLRATGTMPDLQILAELRDVLTSRGISPGEYAAAIHQAVKKLAKEPERGFFFHMALKMPLPSRKRADVVLMPAEVER